ncbi:MAG: glycosyltransferase [Rhodothermaceae bacterium]|nr:glycosyltransferase [Rhodothermaceae bacterium]MXX59770.1 glycosyltransferase [Rhodothermaceae bacterium]MYD19491.1 glycosyltransferase [Rhodothermaceae bacterium]MYD55620.1 glycosyltransferase [Rhodothermaceae bacterium]MYF39643.1 glycosyltransferase [Rhodothermaceae bacterium]
MKDRALIVFARSPVAGQVKSRLTQLLSSQEAADLYRAFLVDSLAQYASLEVDVRLYMADEGDPGVHLYGAQLKKQCGDGLGERMDHAFRETAAEGYEQMVIIGTDHPTLPTEFIMDAYEALSDVPAVCIGPASDGGYYLLGMSPLICGLFDGIVYSKPNVLSLTLVRARESGASVTQLPVWYDVDTPEDLRRLVSEKTALPPATMKMMRMLESRYGL